MTDREYVSLKEYIDGRFNELDKRLTDRFLASDKAIVTAANTLETRLQHLNEFRNQILEERSCYARKDEVELRLCGITEKLDSIAKLVSFSGGKTAGKEWAIGIFIAIALSLAGFVITLVKG